MPEWIFVLLELLSLVALIVGAALIYPPAGIIVAGGCGLWVSSAAPRKRSASK